MARSALETNTLEELTRTEFRIDPGLTVIQFVRQMVQMNEAPVSAHVQVSPETLRNGIETWDIEDGVIELQVKSDVDGRIREFVPWRLVEGGPIQFTQGYIDFLFALLNSRFADE